MFKYYRVIRIIEVQRGDRYITLLRASKSTRVCVCVYVYTTKENGRDFKTYIRDVSNATVEGILYV